MEYKPNFLIRFEEYNKEKQAIENIEDWIRFNKKWFNTKDWPKKTEVQKEEYSRKSKNTIQLDGRTWFYTFLLYDLTPEARYELIRTSNEIGMPLVFPNGVHKPKDLSNTNGWTQECPYDEIATLEIGDEICPLCGRKLIYVWFGD